MGELVGYARVSSTDQDYSLQVEKLTKCGCKKIFYEKQSGKDMGRPELEKAIEYLRPGDKFVVYKIDRLARSIRDLHNLVYELQGKGIGIIVNKRTDRLCDPGG